tara:strand:- start:346 stop:1179 length:834 start_codon:yes stop_codon:yes gene_type:complete
VLLVTYIAYPDTTQLGALDSILFAQVSTAYAIFGVVVALFAPSAQGIVKVSQFLTGTLIVDILATTLLVYSCGGISSGFGLLLIVTIASGSILIRGRISTFLAAVAALAIIYSELYLALTLENPPNQFIQTGILGNILFVTSFYIQTLTQRNYNAALLADKQAGDIIELEKLNNEIIQRMRTGIVVVSPDLRIISMNTAARSKLGPILDKAETTDDYEFILPSALKEQLSLWKINRKRQPQPILIPNSSKQVQLNFVLLNPDSDSDSDVLIFVQKNQ